jgi:hypothetical protein
MFIQGGTFIPDSRVTVWPNQAFGQSLPYVHHYKPLFITNHSSMLTIDKV